MDWEEGEREEGGEGRGGEGRGEKIFPSSGSPSCVTSTKQKRLISNFFRNVYIGGNEGTCTTVSFQLQLAQ